MDSVFGSFDALLYNFTTGSKISNGWYRENIISIYDLNMLLLSSSAGRFSGRCRLGKTFRLLA